MNHIIPSNLEKKCSTILSQFVQQNQMYHFFHNKFHFQGYQGMIDGGDNIVEATWASVSGILQWVSHLTTLELYGRFVIEN